MLRITTFDWKQLFKDVAVDLDLGSHQYCIYVDCEPDTVAKVMNREGKFDTVKGDRIKVPMEPTDLMEIDDSETTGSETKEIFICKTPAGYLMGVYLY
jgi:hypothetical protein